MWLLIFSTAAWPMWGQNPQRTGVTSGTGQIVEPDTLWLVNLQEGCPASPAVADVDGDGRAEVVIGSQSNYLYCLNGEDGSVLWQRNFGNWVRSSAAIEDVDQDGQMEIIIGARDDIEQDTSGVFCLSGTDGSTEWFYTTQGSFDLHSPLVADVDGDGDMEVIISDWDSLYCLDALTGARQWTWVPSGGHEYSMRPAAADVDGDGNVEVCAIGYSGSSYLAVLDGRTGALKWSSPTGPYFGPTLADLNGDGVPEIVVGVYWSGSLSSGAYAYSGDGSLLWSNTDYPCGGNPSVADINLDGVPEVLFLAGNGAPVAAVRGDNGSFLWLTSEGSSWWTSPAVADINGDGALELILNAGSVKCFDSTGALLWRISSGNGSASGNVSSPAIADLDNDGFLEVVAGGTNYYLDRYLLAVDVNPAFGNNHESHDNPSPRLICLPAARSAVFFASENTDIKIYTSDGRLSYSGRLHKGENRIKLETGVYLWQSGTQTGKAVVR